MESRWQARVCKYFENKLLSLCPGQLLAVAFSGPDEPSLLYISAETGKTVRRMPSLGAKFNTSCLGWGSYSSSAQGLPNGQPTSEIFGSLDDTLSSQLSSRQLTANDLPSELTFLDVDSLLSKLSVLSIGGKE